MSKGYYSLVQYCPDRFRAETVNVGLVLLCLDPHTVRVRMTRNYGRVRKLFDIAKAESKNLTLSLSSFANRIHKSADDFLTSDDLATFAASRANDLRLTEPRLTKVDNLDTDFERLFAQLVEQHSSATLAESSPAEVLPPVLNDVFFRLQKAKKIWDPGTITVPIFKRKLEIPYAYQNGVLNYVKPHVFPSSKHAETQAATLAINGDLLQKHPENGEKRRLIIVSTQETLEQAREIRDHVEPLFQEYGVRLIRPQNVEDFAREVERSAH